MSSNSYVYIRFQSTLPRRERLIKPIKFTCKIEFQSTLPRRERRRGALRRRSRVNNFNPRSREGSDDCLPCRRQVASISIHAPAKGATGDNMELDKLTAISIHAPAKGATRSATVHHRSIVYFNPRSREGSDNVQ